MKGVKHTSAGQDAAWLEKILRRWRSTFFSMFLSFLSARKFKRRFYVVITFLSVTLVSLWSFILPFSFPFQVSSRAAIGVDLFIYELRFLTFQISRIQIEPSACISTFFFYYSFLLINNIVGALIGYLVARKIKIENRYFGLFTGSLLLVVVSFIFFIISLLSISGPIFWQYLSLGALGAFGITIFIIALKTIVRKKSK